MADRDGEQEQQQEQGKEQQPVCAFRKPAFRKPGANKAKAKGTGGGGGGGSGAANGGARKRQRKADSSDESSGEGSSEEDESVLLLKSKQGKQAKTGGGGGGGGGGKEGASSSSSAAPINAYQSNRSTVPVPVAGGATYVSEIDTEHDRDQRALMQMAIEAQREGTTNDDTKIYRGQAFYKNYIPKKESQLGGNKYTGTQGPIRAPQYLRATCVFDYKPDICKDYKETGYCGFGDSCKFIHDRGDYKSGYELEAEWEAEQKRKRAKELGEWAGGSDEEDEDQYVITEDDDLPFACFICRDAFRDPVVTACGHYFCSSCALEHHKKDPTCAACGEKTGGVFNFAAKLYEKLKRDEAKKKALAEKEASRAALGLGKGDKGGGDGDGEDEEGDGAEGEEGLVIQEEDKCNVVKRKKGAWSTV